jgi:hypothetical protein
MTKFTFLALTALLATTAAVPAMAQQATQEPGEQAFYRSLGVGSHSVTAAPVRDTYAMVQPRHIAHHTKHHKM